MTCGRWLRSFTLLASICVTWSALAKNELIVDSHTVQLNDTITITLSLEGSFATIDEPRVPLRNLKLLGEPSVSSEFAWINGDVSRRKSFRFVARPIATGPAQVGPIVLTTDDGQRDTLAAVTVQVQEGRVSGSNDAEAVLRELLAARRPPMFVVAEVSRSSAFAGEPVEVTWYLYNAAAIQDWQVQSVPKLAEFWVEELPRGDSAERVYLGEVMVQRVPIRRAVLFPLRTGRIHVEGMTVEAAILQQTRGGPFSMFEGSVVDTTFTSAPFELDVKPIPPGPPVDAVGDLMLRCDRPVQRNAGPVVLRVALEGVGNLRSIDPPHFDGNVAATVQVEGGQVAVGRDEGNVTMTRRWQFLLFPSAPGPLEIPPITMRVFVPATGERRELRCAASIVDVVAPPAPRASETNRASEPPAPVRWPWIAGGIAALCAALFVVARMRRELALRRAVNEVLCDDASPEEIRSRISARIVIDAREASDRGDAWRSLLSLLEARARDRDIAVDSERELRRRVREVLRHAPHTRARTADAAP